MLRREYIFPIMGLMPKRIDVEWREQKQDRHWVHGTSESFLNWFSFDYEDVFVGKSSQITRGIELLLLFI